MIISIMNAPQFILL